MSVECDLPRYDNNEEGLHPHDILITKWFPECTTLELLHRSPPLEEIHLSPKLLEQEDIHRRTRVPTRDEMLSAARDAENDIANGVELVPPQVPWPKPPPRPRSELQAGIEEWRETRLRVIQQILAPWGTSTTSDAHPGASHIAPVALAPSRSPRPENSHIGKTHRALYIPEILEVIVRFLDPASVLALHFVSFALQATVAVVIGSQHRHPYPCGPIEYNERLPVGLDWMPPTKDQIENLEKEISNCLGPGPPSRTRFCCIAQLTQAECISEATLIAARKMWNRTQGSWRTSDHLSMDTLERRWLDLSQVHINPYLTQLFDDRIRKQNGRLEIDLLPGKDSLTNSPLIKQKSLASLIRPMFATEPPCKGLGIYVCLQNPGGEMLWDLGRLQHIRTDDGIRIGQLVDALTQHSPAAVAGWKEIVGTQGWPLAQLDWTNFSLESGKRFRRYWMRGCQIRPKFIILLDSPKPQDDHRCFTEKHFSVEKATLQASEEWYSAFAQADAETKTI